MFGTGPDDSSPTTDTSWTRAPWPCKRHALLSSTGKPCFMGRLDLVRRLLSLATISRSAFDHPRYRLRRSVRASSQHSSLSFYFWTVSLDVSAVTDTGVPASDFHGHIFSFLRIVRTMNKSLVECLLQVVCGSAQTRQKLLPL